MIRFSEYRVTVKSDGNRFTFIRVGAKDEETAIRLVMDYEKCPRRSITNVSVLQLIAEYPDSEAMYF